MKLSHIKTLAMALVCSVGSVSAPGVAQSPGDQKCGANGFVLAYYNGVWMPTLFRCAASGGNGSRDNGGNRDNGSRRQRDDDRNSQGSAVDGDEKCGPDGYVLRFHKAINQFDTDSWQKQYASHC